MDENIEKPLAVIHVDVDSYWTIKQDFGLKSNRDDSIAYSESIPRFLELFDSENVKASFFAIGYDATRNTVADMIQKIVSKGHEIGNHTMNHRTDFANISPKDMHKEIIDCDTILSQVTGKKLIGFRSPGYHFNVSLIDILLQLGYKYDTSSLPTMLFPFMNLTHLFLSGFKKTNKKLGSLNDVCRGIKPYYLNSNGKKSIYQSSDSIFEIPITVMPNLRFPFHSTMIFIFGENLFSISIRLVKLHKLPLIYLFHAVDLFPDINYNRRSIHPTLRLSFAKRYQIVKNIVRSIKNNFEVVSTNEFIKIIAK